MPYKDGKMNGIAKEYYDNGTLSAEKVYLNDEKISRKEYDEKGNLKTPEKRSK